MAWLALWAVTAFARRTGDIAVLSTADIRVLALCLTLEIEENGLWRIREYPGQVLTGPPPKAEDELARNEPTEVPAAAASNNKEDDDLAGTAGRLSLDAARPQTPEAAQAQSRESPRADSSTSLHDEQKINDEEDDDAHAQEEDEDEEEEGDEAGNDSDSSGGSWITPDNVVAHKVKDLGLFDPVEASASGSSPAAAVKPKTVMKAAVLTGDFAMQNVGIQMGLNVLGNGGKRVRNVKTWVLRCHACFK